MLKNISCDLYLKQQGVEERLKVNDKVTDF